MQQGFRKEIIMKQKIMKCLSENYGALLLLTISPLNKT